MTGEEWTKGIEHEAQCVDDPIWAAQARQLARRQRFWASAGRVALAVILVQAVFILGNAVTKQQALISTQTRPWFTTEATWWVFSLSIMALTFLGVGIVTGLFRISPRLGVPVALAFPLSQIINDVLVHRPGSPLKAHDLNSHLVLADFNPWMTHTWFWVQAVVIGFSIWVGIRLVTRWRATRTLARA
ncbi:hypothetical protein ACFFLM_11550 [Deinococcus oregonensis]|uniref:Uncharacterized protein n=1 Tax=Deinococcus oregonensis TaxID=1805970 RepID=A0ABV6B015_9DEIO